MSTDWRALCADLLWALENAIRIIYREDGTKHISTADPIVNRARAALAEPEPEVVEPSDVLDWIRGVEPWATWLAPGGSLESAHFEIARLVAEAVARWGHQPAPPAEGEVGELVAWLRDRAESTSLAHAARRIARAADLLERQAALPLPSGDVEA